MPRTPKQVATPPKPPTSLPVNTDSYEMLSTQFRNSQNSMQQFRTRWEEFLDIAYARLTNQQGFKSRVREGTLSNLLWERAARVVAQLPTGRIQALDEKNDVGKSRLMDIVWHQYVMPGANTDYSFRTKLRMWDYYSMVYGAAPAFYDYRVDDEYVGPDWTVLDPRYVFPQSGRLSLQRCQYVFIEAYHNKEYLKAKLKESGWNKTNINKVLANWTEGTLPDNSKRTTNLQADRGQSNDLHRGEIQLVTKYERGKKGRWITFAPQYDNLVVRDIENPHKSGRLPIVFKYCFPLIDSIWGMGDVERGESLQKAVDTYVNLSMDFAKFKLYPPMWYGDGVNASQLRYEPAAKWKLPNGQNSAGFMQVQNNSSNEMAQGYQFLSGALNRQNGSTTTNIAQDDAAPSQGKSPKAIAQNQQTENTRDNWDTDMLEESITDLTNGMLNLIGTKQPASIEFHIFDEDIKSIYDSGGKDVLEIFESAKKPKITEDGQLDWELSGKGAAKVTIGVDDLKGTYRYYMDAGSTCKADDDDESDSYDTLLETMGTPAWQMLVQGWQQEGRTFSYGEFGKKFLIAKGIEDWEDILPEAQAANGAKQFDPSMLQDPQSMQMLQQAQGQPAQPQQPPQPDPQQMQAEIQKQAEAMAKQMVAQQQKAPNELISYKDASPLTKAHMEAAAGFTPDPVHQIEEAAAMAGHGQTIADATTATMNKPLEPNPQEQIAMNQQQPNQGGPQ